MYYKIVKEDLTSLISSTLSVNYKKMKWVEPHDTRATLCVFDSIDNVNDFLLNNTQNSDYNFYIFECAIEKSNKEWYRCLSVDVINLKLKHNNIRDSFFSWPKGTVLADKVMLIKQYTARPPKQIYYKIVSQDLKSVSIESNRLELSVQYKIDDWTLPRNPEAPLMVFKTLADAENFRTFHGKEKTFIYKCEIIKSNKKWKYLHVYQLEKYHKILELKRNKKRFSNVFSNDYSFPRGTVLADAVKILN